MRDLVAIYVRLSEEDRIKQNADDESRSIQNQKSLLIKYAEEMGWDIYKIYSDEDYQGSDRNRPDFKLLLSDAEKKKFNTILCKSQSRFTRELELVEKYINGLFVVWGIRFVGVTDNADTFMEGNRKSRQINGLVNEWYLEDLSNNIKAVLNDHRRDGKFIGAFAPYGYQKDPDNHNHLIADPDAALIVKEIFTLFNSGIGKNRIAQMLNEKQIPNPTQYKRLQGLRYQSPKSELSTLWRYYTVSDILINEVYIGNMVQGRYASVSYKSRVCKPVAKEKWIRKNGTHEAIIEDSLWNSVQEKLRQKYKPCYDGEVNMFSGKVKCMTCGAALLSHKVGSRRYLRCSTKYSAPSACQGAFIAQKYLEQEIIKELQLIITNYLDNDIAVKRIDEQRTYNDEISVLRKQLIKSQEQSALYEKALQNVYLDKMNSIITEKECIDLIRSLRKTQNSNIENSKRLVKEIDSLEEKKQNVVSKREILSQYIDIKYLNRAIIELLIFKIEIGNAENRKRAPIKIYWNF